MLGCCTSLKQFIYVCSMFLDVWSLIDLRSITLIATCCPDIDRVVPVKSSSPWYTVDEYPFPMTSVSKKE